MLYIRTREHRLCLCSEYTSNMFLLILIILAVDLSEPIKWITEPRTIHVCKGNDVDMLWEFDEEDDKISKLEWYFNKRLICSNSETENFTVSRPYQGRIKRLGKANIQLKSISLDDEGTFSLFPLLTWSTRLIMQNITLQVLEPPTGTCKCKVKQMEESSNYACELTTSDCGRPQLSALWINKNETLKLLAEENAVLMNSSFHDNELWCCPEGIAMKCVNDPGQLCAALLSIPGRDDGNGFKNRRNLSQTDPTTTLALQRSDTNYHSWHFVQNVSLLVSSLTATSLAAIFSFIGMIITIIMRKVYTEQ